jgi:3-isopropylmalate/(R)-2-methylmalate dehydratase large subunit
MRERRILDDKGLSFAEKILSLKNVDKKRIAYAKDIVIVNVDLTMATDGTAPLAIKVFKDMGAKKVWDPSKTLLFLDHTYPPSSDQIANLHRLMRKFAKEQGIKIYEANICHQLILEDYSTSGMLFIGADSHSTTIGCVGAFGTGIGSTDLAAIWIDGKTWLRIPESIKIVVEGKLGKGVFAKDVALKVCKELTSEGANYMSIEYKGSTISSLSIASRATLCNMGIEVGAKATVVEPDEITLSYLKSMKREPIQIVKAGDEANYKKELFISAEELEPLVALPHSPQNVKAVREIGRVEIDQAFLGSCTNGRLEDLEIAADMLKGRKIKEGVRMIVTPASMKVYLDALRKGLIEIFLKAGAVVTNPTCGACVGTHCGILGSGEVAISSSNRNFVGRMGARDSKVYLASPATVAASAINGYITDPRDLL